MLNDSQPTRGAGHLVAMLDESRASEGFPKVSLFVVTGPAETPHLSPLEVQRP